MKRLIFLALMMVCSVSWAKWELCGIGSEGEGVISFYCDKSTIRKNGAISRMWALTDFSSVRTDSSGDRYMSSMVLEVYNCRDETTALTSLTQYSATMGEGKVVWSGEWQERDWKWRSIGPGTVIETKWKIACGNE